jgi:alcohol dehydrogenase
LKQEVLVGSTHLPTLVRLLENKELRRVLLVTGRSSFSDSSASAVLEPYLKGFEVSRFCEFSRNPKIEDVLEGIQVFQREDCQAIIAAGGGSVLDMAKLIKAYQDSINDIPAQVICNDVGLCDIPLVALPTTAGSGSEATEFAVVYIDNKKYSVSSELLRPNLVFLIPELTLSATPYLTATTGMDALTQAIESFWSINSTETSREYSRKALGKIWKYLPLAVHENDPRAKSEVMIAAHLAGKAINIAKTTAAHAISYSFTTYHGIPHGHAVALTIGFFCSYNSQLTDADCNDARGASHVRAIFSEIKEIIGEENLEKALNSFIIGIGLDLYIPQGPEGVDNDIAKILANINAQRVKNNPRFVREADLKLMLKTLFILK